MQKSDTDLCFLLIDSAQSRKSLASCFIPSQPDYKLVAESLSQGTKQEAHKRDEVCAVQVQGPSTIKTLLIKITRGTNQQLKLIVFIVLRTKKSHNGLMS